MTIGVLSFATNYPHFVFSCFINFLVPFAEKILAQPSPENLHLGASCLCRGARHSEIVHIIHNTAFANCGN